MKDIIEIDGKHYKKAKLVMLATDDRTAPIGIDDNSGKLFLFKPDEALWGYQHLYIVTDEEIKEGDWYYTGARTSEYGVVKCDSKRLENLLKDNNGGSVFYKIIATTDSSIQVNVQQHFVGDGKSFEKFSLPRPSNDFIEKFTEMQGNIDEVLVEYEGIEWLDRPLEYFVKTSHNGTITILNP